MADVGGASGAFVFDLDAAGDGTLYGNDADTRRVPASNEKLFTTAAFLDALGPKGHLHTRAYIKGKLGGDGDSVIEGDLVIVGDGDPALATKSFAREANQPVTRVADLATAIAAQGIKRISGRILADDSIFDRKRAAGPDLSPLSGLSFNDGYDSDGSYASAPELNAAKALKSALRKRGVGVGGRVGHANLPDSTLERDPLAEVASPPVATLIEETNVPSNNFFAETLLKRLAAEDGSRGTRIAGAADVERFAKSVGTSIQAVDGSGLSRRNAVSPHEVVKLLAAMYRDPVGGAAFRDSLPIAGREGTVADRMRGTAAEGNCATKTGTLDGVSALSGYCNARGHTVAFSVLNNSVDIDAAHSAQDRIAAAIARYKH
jgi:D-alanyl-D-alanine carboxypeptidase/D-alanyl-D-alanine-endopeptidase (penicillin-binding protein 4)